VHSWRVYDAPRMRVALFSTCLAPGGWLTTVNPIKDTPPLDNDALDTADGVVTTCALAIAQTGTMVLDGGQLVPSVPEAIGRLDPTSPLTFISGPSATVDIEMVRVKGVHGPRTLDVILVAADEWAHE
jgi:L-lactate dehydrogenase complex protein LldG